MKITLTKSKSAAWIALLALLVGIAIFFVHLPQTKDSVLFDDSADYMRAAQSSLLSTWLNTNSAAPWELMHMRSTPEFKAHPWDALYDKADNAALRHFHGPASYYAMHVTHMLSRDDSGERVLAAVAGSLVCAALFAVLAFLDVAWPLAALLALFAGVQSPFVEVSVDPTPHAWYILFSLLFLYYFSRWLQQRSASDLYLSAAILGVSVATLEFSVELFATMAVSVILLWLLQRSTLPSWKETRRPLMIAGILFLLTTFIVWPGGWLRGGYAENYGVLSATVLLKNKAAFGEHLTAGLIYRIVFEHHPLLLLLTLAWLIVGLYLLVRRKLSIASTVFSVYTAMAFLLGVADHFRLNTYVSEYLVFLIAVSGLVASDLATQLTSRLQRQGLAYVFAALLVLGSISEWTQRYDSWGTRPWLTAVFSGIRQHVPAGSTLLVSSDKEALALYAPEYQYQSTVSRTDSSPRSQARGGAAKYGIFDSALPLPEGSTPLARFPISGGHSYVLWKAD